MVNLQKVRISQFLKERVGRYRPNDEVVRSLKRLDKIDFSGNVYLTDKDSKTDMIIIEPGDLVISGINVSKGAIAIYYGKEPITATIHYSSYIFDENVVDINYFKRFIKSQSFVQALKDQVKGGIKTEIKPKHLLPLEIILPEIRKQKEIVSFFDSIENKIGSISNNNNQQRSFIIKLRQQVLQEAIEGKLTAKWRRDHSVLISGDNHASRLLEKIQAEKERLIKEGKIKKEKPLATITDHEKPFELPEGWVWSRLGDICDFITKGTTPPTNELKSEGEIPYLKVYNIVNQKIDFFYRPQYISKKIHEKYNRSKVYPGDVLMNIVGPPLGKIAIVPNSFEEWNINQALAIFRSVVKEMNPYIYVCLLAGFEIKKIHTLGIVGQDNISLAQCRNIICPVPPIDEQKMILKRVGNIMAIIDGLEKQISERKSQSEMLMQSVLREAFATS